MHPITPRPAIDTARIAHGANALDVVLHHISQGMVIVGADYRTLAFNRSFEELFPLPAATLQVGTDFRDILRAWARENGQDDETLARAIRELDLPSPFEFEFAQRIKGSTRWCLLTHNPIPGHGFVRTLTDITDRKGLEESLRRMAHTDTLTGIDNRRAIVDALERELARFYRKGRALSLLSLDLDDFKLVNDTWGHPVGDEVLRRFTACCSTKMRRTDRIGRLGGEEFLMILPETNPDDALILAERLRVATTDLRIDTGDGQPQIAITVSIGMATARQGDSIETLTKRADRALYAAKAAGRNCVASIAD